VKRDLAKLFMSADDLDSESIRTSFKRGADFDAGSLRIRPSWDNARMRDYHEQRRKRGRVPGKYSVRVVVGSSLLRKYAAHHQGRVGRLKAGWISACEALGGQVPAFVRRFAATFGAESGYTDTMSQGDLRDGLLTATSGVPYAGRLANESWWSMLQNKRRTDLLGGYYLKRWQKKMEGMRAKAA
jgi:hypothetical protein